MNYNEMVELIDRICEEKGYNDSPAYDLIYSECCEGRSKADAEAMIKNMLAEYNKLVINKTGAEIDFEAAVEYMDNELREKLHEEIAPCGKQEFFTAYEKAHFEKFGEEWELSKANPVW